MVPDQSDSDECGNRVADDRQAQPPEQAVGQNRELERQLWHGAPCVARCSKASGERTSGQDGCGERTVKPVVAQDSISQRVRLRRVDLARQPYFGCFVLRVVGFCVRPCASAGRAAQKCCAQVAGTVDGVSPAPVGVRVPCEPLDAATDDVSMSIGVCVREGADRNGSGQSAARKVAAPEPFRA